MRVAIQGESGSFHHSAVKEWYGTVDTIIPSDTFVGVFMALNHRDADTAIIAVENSLYGSINEVYDLIESHHYPIVGEIYLRIQQQLITLPGATSKMVKRIYSHPVALAQCGYYLDENFPNAERIEYHDTAASVSFIKELGDPTNAAIASEAAAVYHELPILAKDIENNKENFTRFVILKPNAGPVEGADMSSLLIETNHTPGALAMALTIFADASINLTRLQSRPIVGRPWKYRFYMEVGVTGTHLHSLLETLRIHGTSSIILGEYRANPFIAAN
jgi:prephenate dehydratase